VLDDIKAVEGDAEVNAVLKEVSAIMDGLAE